MKVTSRFLPHMLTYIDLITSIKVFLKFRYYIAQGKSNKSIVDSAIIIGRPLIEEAGLPIFL